MTTGDLLGEVAQLLANKGLEEPRTEAVRLLADVAGAAQATLLAHPERPVAPAVADRVREAARRRADGAPLAYATGIAGFRMLTLAVDPRVLIPRPETEGLVDHVLRWQAGAGAGGVVVDVGTGSGCVALSMATEAAFDRVIGIDVSPAAIAVARDNGRRVGGARVEWLLGNLLEPVAGRRVEVVVANPPYITEFEWERLDPSVRDHEPRLALVSGADGMEAIRRLAGQAHAVLAGRGLLVMEVDSGRAADARRLTEAAGFARSRIEDDLFGRPRYLLASKE